MRNPIIRRVAVVYPPAVAWISRCIDGVRRYAREQGHWHLVSSPPALRGVGGSLTLREMRGWKGDAIIALIDDERELRHARCMGVPVVNLGSWCPKSFGVPRVMVDHFAAGRLAAEHLIERGLRHLAFFGWENAWYAGQRRLGFSTRAAEAGVRCACFLRNPDEEAKKKWIRRIAEPARWLASLPRPCGVFAIHDFMAQLLMESCQEANLRIPDDIALIGMDNDTAICEHSVPTLTSISRNAERVGWEAAALADRMMKGLPAPAGDLLVKTEGVVARQSTDMLYSGEPLVQQALDFMRIHLNKTLTVEQVAGHLGVSKRTLETRFQESLQTSPHAFYTEVRLRHAEALMQGPQTITMERLARESGFGSLRAFSNAFRCKTGKSPGEFRRNPPDAGRR